MTKLREIIGVVADIIIVLAAVAGGLFMVYVTVQGYIERGLPIL